MSNTKNEKLAELSLNELRAHLKELENAHIELDNTQTALKLSANSVYGALGSKYCQWFSMPIAQAITLGGQYTTMNANKHIDEYLRKIVGDSNAMFTFYNDTDSSFVTLRPLVEKFMAGRTQEDINDFVDVVCKTKLKSVLESCFKQQAVDMNCFEPRISMKRENIADKVVMIARKNYIMRVVNKEGGIKLTEPKLKLTGVEAIRSTTPVYCRAKLTEAIKLIFEGDNSALISFIENTEQEFKKTDIYDIAKSISVNGLTDFYDPTTRAIKKGATQQVKLSLTFNKMIDDKNIADKYHKIADSDKIKIIQLKTPNPTHQDAIAFKTTIPVELGLNSYIDYDSQFEKTFLKPLRRILDCIGWKTRNTTDVYDLFG